MSKEYIMAVDDGTTGIRAIIIDKESNVVGQAYELITPIVPHPNWLEQSGEEIWEKCIVVMKGALKDAKLTADDICSIGISCQRCTSLFWDKSTGRQLCNAITWQDTRCADICQKAYDSGTIRMVRGIGKVVKGLSKIVPSIRHTKSGARMVTVATLSFPTNASLGHNRWMIENVKGIKETKEAGNLLCGTIDTWLVWKMTKGAVFATDYSNASSTGMYDSYALEWSSMLCKAFDIPLDILPEVKDTSDEYGVMTSDVLGAEIPIGCVVADQQASLFAQGCFEPGDSKCTHGTGSYIDMNVGSRPASSIYRLLPLIGWGIDGEVTYILEGMANTTGLAVEWLQKNIGLIKSPAETEKMACSIKSTHGVYFVPAFSGLAVPYWDPHACGTVVGLSRKTKREHLVRAALEGIVYRCTDILKAMESDTGIRIKTLKVDGGASKNDFLLQFMADMLDVEVNRSSLLESTAMGAAYFAGLATGVWKSPEEIMSDQKGEVDRVFEPEMSAGKREHLYEGWKHAIDRSLRWRREYGDILDEE